MSVDTRLRRCNVNWAGSLITVILSALAAYYAARVYTKDIPCISSVPPIKFPIQINGKECSAYYQYIDVKGKFATYDNIVLEMKGGKPNKNYFAIARDVTVNGIKINNIIDIRNVSAKFGGIPLDKTKGESILDEVSFADIVSMQGEFLNIHVYDTTNSHFVVEVKLKFKESKPLFVFIKSQENTPTTWKISWRTTIHKLKVF